MPQPRISSQSSPSPKRTSLPTRLQLDIDFHRRLREREERRTHAHLDVLDLEEGAAELFQQPLQVTDMLDVSITRPST
jgi:hypothetical protein